MSCEMSGGLFGEIRNYLDVFAWIYTYSSHLLVTRPTKSRALECFVVETAQRSTHIGLFVSLTTSGPSP